MTTKMRPTKPTSRNRHREGTKPTAGAATLEERHRADRQRQFNGQWRTLKYL